MCVSMYVTSVSSFKNPEMYYIQDISAHCKSLQSRVALPLCCFPDTDAEHQLPVSMVLELQWNISYTYLSARSGKIKERSIQFGREDSWWRLYLIYSFFWAIRSRVTFLRASWVCKRVGGLRESMLEAWERQWRLITWDAAINRTDFGACLSHVPVGKTDIIWVFQVEEYLIQEIRCSQNWWTGLRGKIQEDRSS